MYWCAQISGYLNGFLFYLVSAFLLLAGVASAFQGEINLEYFLTALVLFFIGSMFLKNNDLFQKRGDDGEKHPKGKGL